MNARRAFIDEYLISKFSFKVLCEKHDISTKTAYKCCLTSE